MLELQHQNILWFYWFACLFVLIFGPWANALWCSGLLALCLAIILGEAQVSYGMLETKPKLGAYMTNTIFLAPIL